MYVQREKPKENKNRAISNSVAQKRNNGMQGFGFVDNRPEAVAQRKLQGIANYCSQSKQTAQLKGMASDHLSAPIQAAGNEVVQRIGPLGGLGLLAAGAALGVFGYKLREYLYNWRDLPAEAYARRDKTLTPVTNQQISTLILGAVQAGALPENLGQALIGTANALIARNLLLWTRTGAPHAEAIVSDETEETYRVHLVVAIPQVTEQDIDVQVGMKRGQAIHELVHALQVVQKLGGPARIGQPVPVIRDEQGTALRGVELERSRLPEKQTTQMLNNLHAQLVEDRKKIQGAQWGWYLDRINYGLANRHEVPTVITQIVHDINALEELELLKNTDFYKKLLIVQKIIVDSVLT